MPSYKGNIITVTTIATAGTKNGAASGRWSVTDALQLRANSAWPLVATVPGAPTIGTAVSVSTTSVAVPFTASSDTGGLAITGYTVTSSGGQTATGASSPIIVTGLTTGTSYTFTVTATNSLGTSVSVGTASAIPTTSSVLLLTGDNFLDAASNTTLTNTGVTVNTTTKKFGTGSLYFNSSAYFTIPTLNLTLDFTIECWMYKSYNSSFSIFLSPANGGGDPWFGFNGDQTVYFGSGANQITMASSINNAWTHMAYVRTGTSIKVYVNGNDITTTAYTLAGTVSISVIGAYTSTGTYGFSGYIDDLRVTSGLARYTTNFTPPTSALTV